MMFNHIEWTATCAIHSPWRDTLPAYRIVQWSLFAASHLQIMSSPEPHNMQSAPLAARMAAFSVHVLTALGGGIALLALLEAVREHWTTMFALLGLALLIDVVDGPLARRLDVARLLPDWSGDTLDLVVDFVTYVFVPAYAITASGFLLPLAAPLLGIAIVFTGSLYFADRRMKADDNHFRGFPALWNAVAFYLFLLKPGTGLSTALVALLVVLTFVPFHVVHPVRVLRLRSFNLAAIVVWAGLAILVIARNFQVPWTISATLCAIAAYILGGDLLLRLVAAARGSGAQDMNRH
jgi:phosphatidylcholine synthase